MDAKNCPFCFEPIALAAIKCKHCGEMFSTAVTAKTPAPANARLPSPSETKDAESLQRALLLRFGGVLFAITALLALYIWATGTGSSSSVGGPAVQIVQARFGSKVRAYAKGVASTMELLHGERSQPRLAWEQRPMSGDEYWVTCTLTDPRGTGDTLRLNWQVDLATKSVIAADSLTSDVISLEE